MSSFRGSGAFDSLSRASSSTSISYHRSDSSSIAYRDSRRKRQLMDATEILSTILMVYDNNLDKIPRDESVDVSELRLLYFDPEVEAFPLHSRIFLLGHLDGLKQFSFELGGSTARHGGARPSRNRMSTTEKTSGAMSSKLHDSGESGTEDSLNLSIRVDMLEFERARVAMLHEGDYTMIFGVPIEWMDIPTRCAVHKLYQCIRFYGGGFSSMRLRSLSLSDFKEEIQRCFAECAPMLSALRRDPLSMFSAPLTFPFPPRWGQNVIRAQSLCESISSMQGNRATAIFASNRIVFSEFPSWMNRIILSRLRPSSVENPTGSRSSDPKALISDYSKDISPDSNPSESSSFETLHPPKLSEGGMLSIVRSFGRNEFSEFAPVFVPSSLDFEDIDSEDPVDLAGLFIQTHRVISIVILMNIEKLFDRRHLNLLRLNYQETLRELNECLELVSIDKEKKFPVASTVDLQERMLPLRYRPGSDASMWLNPITSFCLLPPVYSPPSRPKTWRASSQKIPPQPNLVPAPEHEVDVNTVDVHEFPDDMLSSESLMHDPILNEDEFVEGGREYVLRESMTMSCRLGPRRCMARRIFDVSKIITLPAKDSPVDGQARLLSSALTGTLCL